MAITYKVLEISKYDTVTNYTSAAAAIDGVVMRAGYRGYGSSGTMMTDSSFLTHYAGFYDKTKIGVYWFSQAISETEAEDEATYIYSLIRSKNIDFPVYILSDYANTSHTGRADALSKADRTNYTTIICEKLVDLGYRAGVIASDTWFDANLDWKSLYSAGYSIWVVKHSTTAPTVVTSYDGWEYSDEESLSGLSGTVKLSTFYKDVANWNREKPDINTFELTVDSYEFTYTGEEIKPTITLVGLVEDIDYVINYVDNINAGTAHAYIMGIGDYSGNIDVAYTINPQDITLYELTVTLDNPVYDGTSKTVTPYIEGLTLYTDYTMSYSNNINAGTATAFATGRDNYTGTTSCDFTIEYANVADCKFSTANKYYNYTGKAITPEIITDLKEGTDFKATYSNNVEIGTANINIIGYGNYTGETSISFIISDMDIGGMSFTLTENTYTYDGEAHKPEVISDLTEGKDYTLTYGNYINAGEAFVIINPLGEYKGTKKLTYTIMPQDIFDRTIEYDRTKNYYYTSRAIKPEVTVEGLVKDTDFSVTYKNNIDPGTASIIVRGINNYSGSISEDFELEYRPLTMCIAKLGTASTRSIYRIKGPFVIYTEYPDIPLTEDIHYNIQTWATTEYTEFTLYTIVVKGLAGVSGEATYRFRAIDKEPDAPEYADDGVYNFGDLEEYDETAEGDYDFGDLDEGVDPDSVAEGDYDFDALSNMRLDAYDEDDGSNIDEHAIDKKTEPESEAYPDHGTYNFGDIDLGDETAEGDYDFGDLDEGVDPKSKADGDYDFNIISSSRSDDPIVRSWIFPAGTEFDLSSTPLYETYSKGSSFSTRTGKYYVYNNTLGGSSNRVRMCRLDSMVEMPGRSSGWCSTVDLLNLGNFIIGSKVNVLSAIYVNPDGTGGTIDRQGEVMYVSELLDTTANTYPFGLSTTATSKTIGYIDDKNIEFYK